MIIFLLPESLIAIAVGDAGSPHRFKFSYNSEYASGSAWTHRFTFYTPEMYKSGECKNGAQIYSVGQASNPHRFRIFEVPNPTKKTIAGWYYVFEFCAYPVQKLGTISYAVGQAMNPPSRFRVLPNSVNAGVNGWTHRFVFWAYPSKTTNANNGMFYRFH